MAQKQPQDMHTIDEDDEFEEFPQENWQPKAADLRARNLWDKAWDDESLEDEVGKQLRAKLPSIAHKQPTSGQ